MKILGNSDVELGHDDPCLEPIRGYRLSVGERCFYCCDDESVCLVKKVAWNKDGEFFRRASGGPTIFVPTRANHRLLRPVEPHEYEWMEPEF